MTLYSVILFVHVTAVLALFAALTLEALSLYHLRRASSLAEIRLWMEPVPGLPLAAMGSLLVVFFSGIYLTIQLSVFGAAWPKVTIAALLLIAPIAAITGRRMRAIRQMGADATAFRRGTARAAAGSATEGLTRPTDHRDVGPGALMGAQPALWESVGIVAGSVLLGLLAPLLL